MRFKTAFSMIHLQTFFKPVWRWTQDLPRSLCDVVGSGPLSKHYAIPVELQLKIVYVTAIGVGTGFNAFCLWIHPNRHKGIMGILAPISEWVGHPHTQRDAAPTGLPAAHEFFMERLGPRHFFALPLKMAKQKLQLAQEDAPLFVVMHWIKLERVGGAWLGQQRAGRRGALGKTQHSPPIGLLDELGEHGTALPYTQGCHGGLLAGSLTLRGGQAQAALVYALLQDLL